MNPPIVGHTEEEFRAKVKETIERLNRLHEESGDAIRKAERLLAIAAEREVAK